MNKCVIFCAGKEVSPACISIDELKDSFVISADKGFMLAKKF